jgi:phosphoribosylformimino-5-aminoimidazole carboxamide ribotide isomerase
VALANAVEVPVIASGGVASLEDLTELRDAGIPGVILGRALYDGRVDPAQALSMLRYGSAL